LNIGQYLTYHYNGILSQLQCHLALQIEFEWIKGHQTANEDLEDVVGILFNTNVDKLATNHFVKQTTVPQCMVHFLQEQYATIKMGIMYRIYI
jgi:hypothetical protein